MVAMDPDSEFNALSALYQSVVHDMKSSYAAWETVSARAQKLSSQLRSAAGALSAFNEAVQGVSDLANNLKGASRDAGACVTRVCMRQRTVESRFRGMADALADELAISLKQRVSYWKQRTADLDKTESKFVSKIRSRKGRPDEASVCEQRALCHQLLLEQRTQFAFFVNAFMPVLTTEVALLEEGLHIRPVAESLDATLKHVDADQLVQTILADMTQGAESAWRTCLSGVAMNGVSWLSSSSDEECRSSSGASHSNVGKGASRMMNKRSTSSSTQSSVVSNHQNMHSIHVSEHLPSSASDNAKNATNGLPPPLTSFRPSSSFSANNSSYSLNPASSVQNEGLSILSQRVQRPISFAGDFRPAPPAYPGTNGNYTNGYGIRGAETPSVYSSISSNGIVYSAIGETVSGEGTIVQRTACLLQNQPSSSSCSSSDHASSLIAETLQQIEQLGPDLDAFCNGGGSSDKGGKNPTVSCGGNRADYGMIDRGGGVRVRAESTSRPPPPERRSSAITSATPSAPSVAETRHSLASSSLKGSRQSLVSSHSNTSSIHLFGPMLEAQQRNRQAAEQENAATRSHASDRHFANQQHHQPPPYPSSFHQQSNNYRPPPMSTTTFGTPAAFASINQYAVPRTPGHS